MLKYALLSLASLQVAIDCQICLSSAGMGTVVRVRVEGSPLPSIVKRKWENWDREALKTKSIEEIEAKLTAAEQRREQRKEVTTKLRSISGSENCVKILSARDAQRLEDKLAAAQAKRTEILRLVQARAAARLGRAVKASQLVQQRKAELTSRLDSHLAQAEMLREARLAETAAKAAGVTARAKEVKAEAEMRYEMELARRRLSLLEKLQRAATARKESVEARLAAMPQNSGEGFLPRQAARRAQLRRQNSSRRLQRCWRAFAAQVKTTRALGQALVDTDVPFSVHLEAPSIGPSMQPAATAADPSLGTSAGPTPLSIPSPCSSPTSTVRRSNGMMVAGRSAVETPSNTPLPTPGTSPSRRPSTPAGDAPPVPSSPPPAWGTTAFVPGTPQHQMALMAAAKHPFDEFAAAISAPTTLRAASALLARLETKVTIKGVGAGGSCESLLKRLFPRAPKGRNLERYPARIFLCAYMVLAHPEVVFNAKGEREEALTAAARDMLTAFEHLLRRLTEERKSSTGEDQSLAEEASMDLTQAVQDAQGGTSVGMLQRFDESWVAYLEQFAAWKLADAAGLEGELIRMAVELESSKLAKLAPGSTGSSMPWRRSEEDIQAMKEQVARDLRLIQERVRRLTGAQGEARLEAALAAARAAAALPVPPSTPAAAAAPEPPAAPFFPHTSPSPSTTPSPSASPIKKVAKREGGSGGPGARVRRRGSSQGEEVAAGAAAEDTLRQLYRTASLAVDMDSALSEHGNLQLMWQLLHDASWRLPTAELDLLWTDALGDSDPMQEPAVPAELEGADLVPEQVMQRVQSRVRRIAERAFWDSVQERLEGKGGQEGSCGEAAEQVAGILSDLASQLVEVLPEGSAAGREIRDGFGRDALLQQLLPPPSTQAASDVLLPSINTQGLFLLLEAMVGWLAALGAPARETAAADAAAAVRQQLQAAAAAHACGAAAAAATRGLRVLCVLLKQLRADAANAQLAALSCQLSQGGGGVSYARAKLEEILGTPVGADLAARLPHARGWLALTSSQLIHVEQQLQQARGESQPAQQLPSMRSGRGVPTQQGQQVHAAPASLASLEAPVEARSWRGLVRVGLVTLVSGEGAVARLASPETLRLDTSRLHDAQNEFQRCLVITVCLLLLKQSRQSMGKALSAVQVVQAKRRLAALLADPSMRLADLASEINRLAGGPPCAEREGVLQDSLNRMLSRSAGALKAVTSGITHALHALLLMGPAHHVAQHVASTALLRCGAEAVKEEVAGLASKLAGVAGVGEAVFGPWYTSLSVDLL